jgi:ketosteroid isomerase-like protein
MERLEQFMNKVEGCEMELMETASALVAGCRDGRDTENLDTLYAPDAVSVEAVEMAEAGKGRETHGIDGIRAKHEWWNSTMEMLGGQISDPMPHGEDRFAVIFRMKAKDKASGHVMDMEEVGIYTVANGKITREEFYYAMPDG